MKENNFFKSFNFLHYPAKKEIVLFSCDDLYFKKFGIFNIISCNEVGHDIHFHIINPSKESLELFNNIKSKLRIQYSYSTELLETKDLNFYALKSYYYCSRYYVATFLFENTLVEKIHIVDTDAIFNDKIVMKENIDLSLEYNDQYNNLWQKIMAGYVFIEKKKSWFLKEVLFEYEKRYDSTDFAIVSNIENKIEKANFTGLDQVCLSYVFELYKLNLEDSFYNLLPIKSQFKSKGDNLAKIWMILGKSKVDADKYLRKKYIKYFDET